MSRDLLAGERKPRMVRRYKGGGWFYAGLDRFSFYRDDEGSVSNVQVPTSQLIKALESIGYTVSSRRGKQ